MGGGLGLMGIRERARAMGGTAAVQSAPGSGTSIVVTVPLEGRDHGR
jgi:signal transduction histidine kinase